MNSFQRWTYVVGVICLLVLLQSQTAKEGSFEQGIITYIVDPQKQDLQLFWKDDKGEVLGSLGRLKDFVEKQGKRLEFAMNGGMYQVDRSPQGLFILNGTRLKALNEGNGSGNFYMKPNGVFYVTSDNRPKICKTSDFQDQGTIRFATQSGPMLVIDGKIHDSFKLGSKNLNIRNGVGILPNNKVVFAMSKDKVNFYDFAKCFQDMGCKNALYLDGFVSRMYLPEKKWIQTDGEFGVIIGVLGAIK